MGWIELAERVAAKSKFDASVRLYQRSAASKPTLIISLRKTIMADLKWKPNDVFGLAIGSEGNVGKVRIIRRKDKAIAKPRQMKTGSLSFDFGYVAQLGERGTFKADAVARVINADTVEVDIPAFEYEDEAADEEDEEGEEEQPPQARAPDPPKTRAPAVARPSPTPPPVRPQPPITISGISINFDPDEACVSYRGQSMEITDRQAQVIATLAKAMPQPVGREFIVKKVFVDRHPNVANMALDQIYTSLAKVLPGIGLQIKNVKGVGFALQEAA